MPRSPPASLAPSSALFILVFCYFWLPLDTSLLPLIQDSLFGTSAIAFSSSLITSLPLDSLPLLVSYLSSASPFTSYRCFHPLSSPLTLSLTALPRPASAHLPALCTLPRLGSATATALPCLTAYTPVRPLPLPTSLSGTIHICQLISTSLTLCLLRLAVILSISPVHYLSAFRVVQWSTWVSLHTTCLCCATARLPGLGFTSSFPPLPPLPMPAYALLVCAAGTSPGEDCHYTGGPGRCCGPGTPLPCPHHHLPAFHLATAAHLTPLPSACLNHTSLPRAPHAPAFLHRTLHSTCPLLLHAYCPCLTVLAAQFNSHTTSTTTMDYLLAPYGTMACHTHATWHYHPLLHHTSPYHALCHASPFSPPHPLLLPVADTHCNLPSCLCLHSFLHALGFLHHTAVPTTAASHGLLHSLPLADTLPLPASSPHFTLWHLCPSPTCTWDDTHYHTTLHLTHTHLPLTLPTATYHYTTRYLHFYPFLMPHGTPALTLVAMLTHCQHSAASHTLCLPASFTAHTITTTLP